MSYPGDRAPSLSLADFHDGLRRPVAQDEVASFQPSPEIQRLDIRFDIGKLRQALREVERRKGFSDDVWGAIPLPQRPGHQGP